MLILSVYTVYLLKKIDVRNYSTVVNNPHVKCTGCLTLDDLFNCTVSTLSLRLYIYKIRIIKVPAIGSVCEKCVN